MAASRGRPWRPLLAVALGCVGMLVVLVLLVYLAGVAATGQEVEPEAARFAAPPSGLSHFPSNHAVSPDGTRRVEGYKKQARVVFEGVGGPPNQFGLMVQMTAAGKTWTWRLGDAYGLEPAVAFSSDGRRLAATTGSPAGGSVVIWSVPKG